MGPFCQNKDSAPGAALLSCLHLFPSTLRGVSLPPEAGREGEEEEQQGKTQGLLERRVGGRELKKGYEEGQMTSVKMGTRVKLHKSGLTLHQLNEHHAADKHDERNNDDSGGANRLLFLDAFSLLAVCNCALYERVHVSLHGLHCTCAKMH